MGTRTLTSQPSLEELTWNAERDAISTEEAVSKIRKMDRMRAVYYRMYTGCGWGNAKSYELCVNISKIHKEKVVGIIMEIAECL